MKIDPADLDAEFVIAWRWPQIRGAEIRYGLPTYCLFAVGSRETDLSPRYVQGATGDGSHGHGIWQYDDRWHVIPSTFDRDIGMQAEIAANMLSRLIAAYGEVGGYNAYNSGSPITGNTTDKDYGPDVQERRLYLVGRFPTTGEDDMYWGKDGADLAAQVADARTCQCRAWWLLYHANREPSVSQLQSAVTFWASNGGDLTQAGIRDGRFG